MKLAETLGEDLILTDFLAKDKWDALGKLVDLVIAQGRLAADHRRKVLDALVAREKIASTGMENGVALPHATVDVLEEAVLALAISPAGIPFQSADGRPARLIVLLVIPRKAVKMNSQTLARIARLLNYEETREALARARSPREAHQIIREEEQKGNA